MGIKLLSEAAYLERPLGLLLLLRCRGDGTPWGRGSTAIRAYTHWVLLRRRRAAALRLWFERLAIAKRDNDLSAPLSHPPPCRMDAQEGQLDLQSTA